MAELLRVEWPATWEDAPPSAHPGRALNAWLYGQIARVDEDLATDLHDGRGAKPVTVAIATPAEGRKLVVTGCGHVAIRLGAVAESVSGRMLLDGRWLALGAASAQEDSWAGLAGRWLLPATRPVPARLEFLTPTAFHSRGRTLPLPMPTLVFSGLLALWQAWSSLDLGEGAREAIDEHVVLSRYHTRSEWVQMQGRLAAFRGWADFTLAGAPEGYAGLVALLAAFAEYVGIGQKTAMGMGCVRARLRPPA